MGVGFGEQTSGTWPSLGAVGGKVSDEAELGRSRGHTLVLRTPLSRTKQVRQVRACSLPVPPLSLHTCAPTTHLQFLVCGGPSSRRKRA